ncbi:ATP-binding cassette domain-containing protein [Tunturiibacter gelidoferens]|uniref:Osmoprotectant transport system ATP-binding protein n=1 Tax=Tunturiibacter gelidiferens TaxID=3069689 RepID=A0ACC5NWC2_9BACT|nr:ATP-binding cassette domain-containing protein [Edaphobacter lichenicola]MBB5338897.1 osmoprotectant transport system ATP-binding protein [Edaphobacter lichenicola]
MPTVGVEFAKVSYTLAGGRVLLRDVSLQLEAGTTTALLGRSGSGKTTLLRMVNRLVTPSEGEVLVAGNLTQSGDIVALRRSIGYVIQETGLFPHMTVERNAGMALELAGRSKSEIAKRVHEVISLVGLEYEEFRGRYPWQLSGGQRQRVGLARALATDPTVLLMDEPFGALDPLTRAEMQTMLRDLLKKVGKTVLLVTHDLDEALYLANRVVFLSEGTVVADLSAGEVARSENLHVKDYVSAVHRTVQA